MDRYMITHSLLYSWLYAMKENPYEDSETEKDPMKEFLDVLNRIPTETNQAMQNGIDFEDLVTAIVEADPTAAPKLCRQVKYNYSTRTYDTELVPPAQHMWFAAAAKVAGIVDGGQLQCVASKTIEVNGMQIFLYGRLDALKAGSIYDIKFSKGYDRGKYVDSTQHPTYFELVPEADDFTYLVSNGSDVWTETYRKEETQDIKFIISDFLSWLTAMGLMDIFKEKWLAK